MFRPEPLDGPPVTAAPFSAEESAHEIELLGNGTRNDQSRLLRKLYRDSQGRIRSEHRLSLGPGVADSPLVVEIYDAVANYHYTLDLEKKIAHRYVPPKPGAEIAAPPRKETEAAVAIVGKPPGPASSRNDQPVRRVAVATLGAPEGPPSEKLGLREFDGLAVEGVRYTTTVPSGTGAARIATSEIWTSTDLKVKILSKLTDSQGGERTVRLNILSRAESDPALFQVPPGFVVQDEPGEFRIDFTIGK